MKKIETIWHYILWDALENRNFKHTQKELAEKLGYSISTVNASIDKPYKIGAVRKSSKFFELYDYKKLLYFWATNRNLNKDIIYATHVDLPVLKIEASLPSSAIYACYSAARHLFGEPPADYSKVYFYADDVVLKQAKKRFSYIKHLEPNLYILKSNSTLPEYGSNTTLPHTFVDVWNLPDWYSKDFIDRLELEINGILS